MNVVTETISREPFDSLIREIERDERRLFEAPPEAAMRFLVADLPPLAVYSTPVVYEPVKFGRPQGVFEGSTLRLEWQTINGRQPFYHRNADVDEIGYQICGERTLMTECGTIEFEAGQFARIPVGVAHDNYGREDIHLIFYLHGPVETCAAPIGRGEHRVPPFPDWQATSTVEALTDAMGGPGGSIAYSMADELMLLDAAKRFPDLLEVLEPHGPAGTTEWLYKAPKIWIGNTWLEPTSERRYQRRLCTDEIQYQAKGRRTIVSQRGVVTLEPGDFVCIPKGCAHASITDEMSGHLSLLTVEPVPAMREPTRFADADLAGWLDTRGAAAPGAAQCR